MTEKSDKESIWLKTVTLGDVLKIITVLCSLLTYYTYNEVRAGRIEVKFDALQNVVVNAVEQYQEQRTEFTRQLERLADQIDRLKRT